jgi:ABC-type lipoprotein release transport system permease subunit
MGRRIVGRGLLVTLMGLGAGLSLAVAAVDVIRSQLYSVSPFDVPSVVAACGALVVAALIASVWPAVRAMRVEPAELLRSE